MAEWLKKSWLKTARKTAPVCGGRAVSRALMTPPPPPGTASWDSTAPKTVLVHFAGGSHYGGGQFFSLIWGGAVIFSEK